MLSRLKNLSLLNKIISASSLFLLLVWVIPSMVEYYKNVREYESKTEALHQVAQRYNVEESSEPFDEKKFKNEVERLFSSVNIVSTSEKNYNVTIKMKREDVDRFNSFLEALSLHYLVTINGPLKFEEKNKKLEVQMSLLAL